jgi:hypothetical protein
MSSAALYGQDDQAKITELKRPAYAFVILQHWTLKHKESSFPAAKILSSLGQVAFLVSNLRYGFLGLPYYVRSEEGDNLVLVLHGEIDQCLQICFKRGLRQAYP